VYLFEPTSSAAPSACSSTTSGVSGSMATTFWHADFAASAPHRAEKLAQHPHKKKKKKEKKPRPKKKKKKRNKNHNTERRPPRYSLNLRSA